MNKNVQTCAQLINESNNITVLSGAGLSTKAGIPDFRGPDGIYNKIKIKNPENIFDIFYFYNEPSLFYKFHKEFLKNITNANPTFTHNFFVDLENKNKLNGIITQNIDSLHQKAGNKKVNEIHGGIWDNYCIECNKHYSYESIIKLLDKNEIAKCDICNSVIKPDIVFFGEQVKNFEYCRDLVEECDLLIIVGSSLSVVPASLLPYYCNSDIIIVNKGDIFFDYIPQDNLLIYENNDIDSFFVQVKKYCE